MYRIVQKFCGTKFSQILQKIPVHENIITNMLFPYISTVMTYLVHEKLNLKFLF